jgi:predicted GNAT family acetyltransferase
MTSLYAQYINERFSDYVIETDEGFATYRYLNDEQVYIVDIFVQAKFRKTGVAKKLADQICKEAKSEGCTEVIGTVMPSAKNATTSLLVLIAYGMKIKSCSENVIVMSKEI